MRESELIACCDAIERNGGLVAADAVRDLVELVRSGQVDRGAREQVLNAATRLVELAEAHWPERAR